MAGRSRGRCTPSVSQQWRMRFDTVNTCWAKSCLSSSMQHQPAPCLLGQRLHHFQRKQPGYPFRSFAKSNGSTTQGATVTAAGMCWSLLMMQMQSSTTVVIDISIMTSSTCHVQGSVDTAELAVADSWSPQQGVEARSLGDTSMDC